MKLWEMTVVAQFEAEDAEDAAVTVKQLAARVLEPSYVWAVDIEFDPDQVTETVDA